MLSLSPYWILHWVQGILVYLKNKLDLHRQDNGREIVFEGSVQKLEA